MSGSENSTAIMFYYVYVLQSIKNNALYVGYTSNLKKSLKTNQGSRLLKRMLKEYFYHKRSKN
jgi:predicted GIY-YIG superfamily endonuclease